MHHIGPQPTGPHDHGAALTDSAAREERKVPPGDGIAVDQPGCAHQRHADEPEKRVDQPVQPEKILGPHKIIGDDGIQIGTNRQRQRGQYHPQQVFRRSVLPHGAVKAENGKQNQPHQSHSRGDTEINLKERIRNGGGIAQNLRKDHGQIDQNRVQQKPQPRADGFLRFGFKRHDVSSPCLRN